tara:strand:+ start:633 stop:1397 length:765 start_codon:yes stop_codon:yes gene_type:complete
MSLKSVIQIIILTIIFIILGGVYLKYFSKEKIMVDESIQKSEQEGIKNSKETVDINQEKKVINNGEIKKKVKINDEKSKLLTKKNKEIIKNKEKINLTKKDNKKKKNEIPNLVKDVEYLTTDKNGNNFKILAYSGRTNKNDKNILDLDTVNGEVTSENRSTIYIVSDFAEYNSATLGSKFYSNVIINYEDKQINCQNFDINMDTNIAIAYNGVVVTDPKSIMKAQRITLNIETKEININPEQNNKSKIKINTKQ